MSVKLRIGKRNEGEDYRMMTPANTSNAPQIVFFRLYAYFTAQRTILGRYIITLGGKRSNFPSLHISFIYFTHT